MSDLQSFIDDLTNLDFSDDGGEEESDIQLINTIIVGENELDMPVFELELIFAQSPLTKEQRAEVSSQIRKDFYYFLYTIYTLNYPEEMILEEQSSSEIGKMMWELCKLYGASHIRLANNKKYRPINLKARNYDQYRETDFENAKCYIRYNIQLYGELPNEKS